MFSIKTLLLALALVAFAAAMEMETTMMGDMGNSTMMDDDFMEMDGMGNSTMMDDDFMEMDGMDDMDHYDMDHSDMGHMDHSEEDHMDHMDDMGDMDHSHGHDHSDEMEDIMEAMGCHCMGKLMMGCGDLAETCSCTGTSMKPECTSAAPSSKMGLFGIAIAGVILAASL